MKLYSSLIYRELIISKKHYLIRGILLGLLMVFTFLPLYIIAQHADDNNSIDFAVFMLAAVVAMLSAIIVGTDNDVHKKDILTGWHTYSLVLPATALQRATARYVIKAVSVLICGVCCAAYVLLLDKSVFAGVLNVYLVSAAIFMLADTFTQVIQLFAKDKKSLKILRIVGLGAGLALFELCLHFTNINVTIDEVDAKLEGNTSDKYFAQVAMQVIDKLGNPLITAGAAAALIAVIAAGFFMTAKLLERREP